MFETFPSLQSQCVMEPSQEARPPDHQSSTPIVGAEGRSSGSQTARQQDPSFTSHSLCKLGKVSCLF